MWLWPWGKETGECRVELNALLEHLAQEDRLAEAAAELIAEHAATVDPTLGSPVTSGVKMLRLLQQLNVRGHRLWDLYCFVVREDLRTFVLVLRAYQLGLVTCEQIDAAIDDDQCPLNLARIKRAVEAMIPELRYVKRVQKKSGLDRLFSIDWTGRGGL